MPLDALAILEVAAPSVSHEPCTASNVTSLEGVVEHRRVTSGGREYFTFTYDGVSYRSRAAVLRVSGVNAKAKVPRPRVVQQMVRNEDPAFWGPCHCESSRCTFDLGHQGHHSHEFVAGKRRR